MKYCNTPNGVKMCGPAEGMQNTTEGGDVEVTYFATKVEATRRHSSCRPAPSPPLPSSLANRLAAAYLLSTAPAPKASSSFYAPTSLGVTLLCPLACHLPPPQMLGSYLLPRSVCKYQSEKGCDKTPRVSTVALRPPSPALYSSAPAVAAQARHRMDVRRYGQGAEDESDLLPRQLHQDRL